MELVEVTMEDLQTLVEVVDREVLELEEVGASGLEQLQVVCLDTCLVTEATQDIETMEDTIEAGAGVVEDTTEVILEDPSHLEVVVVVHPHLVPELLQDLEELGEDKCGLTLVIFPMNCL